MATKSSISELYNELLGMSKISHPDMRAVLINRINSITRSNEDTSETTAYIFALMAYHESKKVKKISEYPGSPICLPGGKLYYKLDSMDPNLIKVLSAFMRDT